MTGPTPHLIEPGELKALVRQLVKAAGGVDACGIELGVSAERVSQYQRPGCADQMPVLFICRLETVAGRPIVTGALARASEGGGAPEEIGRSAVDTVGSAAALMRTVHEMEADGHRSVAEKRDVMVAASDLLKQAQEAFDAAARLVGSEA